MNAPTRQTGGHTPVLLAEVVAALDPRAGAVFVDGTLGAGGYSRALLEAADCTVWGIDRDPDAIARTAPLRELYAGRFHALHGRFGDMRDLLAAHGVTEIDGVTLDLGVSSPQLDEAARGFSFAKDGPLDMRMSRDGETAADVVNHAGEGDLADIIYSFGEERLSRRIARAIVAARADKPIETTGELAGIVRAVMPKPSRNSGGKGGGKGGGQRGGKTIDPATRTFQALRIHVNDELGELDRGLAAAEALLRPGGRLAVVSFHSLEDRRVKQFLRTRSGGDARASRHLPEARTAADRARRPAWTLLARQAIKPGAAECAANPRARSARLRVGVRTDAPAWSVAPVTGEAPT
jgi:16S rRNA (cytosine1402-N4)-methyltransferase